jgi:hypothetical protein
MPKIGIMALMSKPRVTFKFDRVAEGEWQIEAHYPGAEIRYINRLAEVAGLRKVTGR